MRLKIRPEQRAVIEEVARENFVHRLAAHLRAEYSGAAVTLPDAGQTTVGELDEATLDRLVRVGIARAGSHEISLQSAIAAFVAVMFEVAPNFDTHRLSRVLLGDEEVAPDARLDELLNVLTEKNWESIRAEYDPQAWEMPEEAAETAEAAQAGPPADAAPDKTPPETLDPFQTVRVDYKG